MSYQSPTDISAVNLVADVDVLLPVPASVSGTSKTFLVTVAAQPRQDLTNPAPVYTASLGGVSFTLPKAGGVVTVPNVPITAGGAVRLVHQVNHPSINMRAALETLFGVGIGFDVPALSSASAMEILLPKIVSVEPQGGWSPAGAANICSNPTNAIRAVTANVTHSALGWDSSIASAGNGNIIFARPNSERIVLGAYTVGYSVALNGYGGYVGVSIGGQLVYAADGGQIIYQWNQATISNDNDVDVLPVVVEGGGGVVVLAISSASRTVGTGNIDGSKYATLAYPSTRLFRAAQTDDNPQRGTIARARLALEWFGNGIIPDNTVRVSWAGRVLGYLAAQSLGAQTLNKNVSVDVTSPGAATINSSYVSTTVSGGTASLSHATVAQSANIAPVYYSAGGGATYRSWSRAPKMPSISGNITVTAVLANNDALYPSGPSSSGVVNLRRGDNSNIAQISLYSATPEHVATNQWAVTSTISEVPDNLFFDSLGGGLDVAIQSVSFSWNAYLTNAVTQNNTPASGGTSFPNGNLPVSGVALQTNNGNISLTIPDSPRTTVTLFDLPDVRQWGDLTGKVVEVEIMGACPSVQLIQAQLAVDYNAITHSVPGALTATVSGLSGNPADVLKHLALAAGEQIDTPAFNKFWTWCNANHYQFARRIADVTDALWLLAYAAEQAGVILSTTPNGIAPIRWFDMSELPAVIDPADLLEPASITWATRIDNEITLNYREDYANGGGFSRTLIANADNNADCRKSQAQIKEVRAITVEAGFIRDNITAANYLAYLAKRHAQPHRLLTLKLPFTYSDLSIGSLIDIDVNVGVTSIARLTITARVTQLSDDNGWIDLTAEQIL